MYMCSILTWLSLFCAQNQGWRFTTIFNIKSVIRALYMDYSNKIMDIYIYDSIIKDLVTCSRLRDSGERNHCEADVEKKLRENLVESGAAEPVNISLPFLYRPLLAPLG